MLWKAMLFSAWITWGVIAIVYLSEWFVRIRFQVREEIRVESMAVEEMSADDLRVLMMGDARDPIERNHDAMTRMFRFACFAITFMFLIWLSVF